MSSLRSHVELNGYALINLKDGKINSNSCTIISDMTLKDYEIN